MEEPDPMLATTVGKPRPANASAAHANGWHVRHRPAISVVVPFGGSPEDADEMLAALHGLRVGAADEILVVDNTADGLLTARRTPATVRVVHAGETASSYYARNVGVERASNEWLLFIDADCRPSPGLLDDYFDAPIPDQAGIVGGAVVADGDCASLAERYWSRRQPDLQLTNWSSAPPPRVVTANALVRRAAWDAVGGFCEGVRSGGDVDFCWRLQVAGWEVLYRSRAAVRHRQRASVRSLLRQQARYGAGRHWLNVRHGVPGTRPHVIAPLARCTVAVLHCALKREPASVVSVSLDAAVIAATGAGYLLANASGRRGLLAAPAEVAIFADRFPEYTETFVANEVRALQAAGCRVRVEARSRPPRQDRRVLRDTAPVYVEDESVLGKLSAMAILAARRPFRCLADVIERRRWRVEEPVLPLRALAPLAVRLQRSGIHHLHVHFAGAAALDALRVGRILARPYSVAVHAFDVFQSPRNLAAKMGEAAFVTTVSDYNVHYLRSMVDPAHRDRIHRVVMGVDLRAFSRSTPYPGGRRLLAIGRLIEKKGFRHLVDAVALLGGRDSIHGLTIVGAGPLRGELEELARTLGVSDVVDLAGAHDHDEVRRLLEVADVVVVPSVLAADGDRDGMPVVLVEALAMEVPVVASDVVGMREMMQPGWGRLAAPGDAEALALAIAELMTMPVDERRAMGQAGREWVAEHADVRSETAKLIELIGAAARA